MKTKKNILVKLLMGGVLLLSTITYAQTTGNFTDSRDGKIYKTVEIGNQVWMAENLAYKPNSGNYWAYDDSQSNVPKYGYLYDLPTAKNVCPSGWHLPTLKEWKQLKNHYGGKKEAGAKMISEVGGDQNGNVNNEIGFSALPGGMFLYGDFASLGKYSCWWSTEPFATVSYNLSDLADAFKNQSYWMTFLNFKNSKVNFAGHRWYNGASVRCLKD